MKRFRYILILGGLSLLLSSCLDEIELKNQRFGTKAVIIQGRLILGAPSLIEVNVQRIGEFDGAETSVHIGSAKVTLEQTDGSNIDLQEITSAKLYRASIPNNHPTFKVRAGQSYRIKVSLLDGRQYESEFEPLLPVPELEKTSYTLQELTLPDKKGFLNKATYLSFWVNSKLKTGGNPDKSKLRWELNAVYRFTDDTRKLCYNFEPQRVDKVLLYDGPGLQLERLDTFYLADVRLDHRFAEGFYLTVLQESLSTTAFNYWNQVKTLAERSGSMFEEPAAKIASNLRSKNVGEEVYGYFYATAQDTLRLYIRPEQVGSPTKYCPQPPTPRIGPTVCDNCLLNTGSTLTKPNFWIE
ncbi:MAG: DUF4249 family protein [Haliscomenobacter sp.]|uniref:DUF4249 family protein n=1 Tax=Haliscomenobacter sp. TaxID=2717303 RepID=UPI0029B372B4|nr:DUF4249 family protein [Haliscomenobacter sp.]MDX2072186.1 DUF4249 family protein [Haliscomenobacter sp.]